MEVQDRPPAGDRFPAIRDHVLLPFAGPIPEADARLAGKLDADRIEAIAAQLPGDWADAATYAAHLTARHEQRAGFVEQAEAVRAQA